MKKVLFNSDIYDCLPKTGKELMDYGMDSALNYLQEDDLTEAAKMLNMKNPEDADVEEITNNYYYEANHELQEKFANNIVDKVADAMMEDTDWCNETEREIYEHLDEELRKEGLLKKPEPCLIFVENMGWRNLYGHKLTHDISEGKELVDNLHGDYEYTAEIYHEDNKPYLNAIVSSHDSPTGEFYTIIPMSWMKEALHSDIKKRIENAMLIDDDVRDEVRETVPALVKGKEAIRGIEDFILYMADNSYYTYHEKPEKHKKEMLELSKGMVSLDFPKFKKDMEEGNISMYATDYFDFGNYAFTNGDPYDNEHYNTGKYHISKEKDKELVEKITNILIKNDPREIKKMVDELYEK